MERILYTRSMDGSDPVYVRRTDNGSSLYVLSRSGVGEVEFSSARRLLIELTGHPEARHWTLDRYFRLGRYRRGSGGLETPILDVYGVTDAVLTTVGGSVPIRQSRGRQRASGGLGIDLVMYGKDVERLLRAGFGGVIRKNHYDMEEVLQEVFKGILIRNQGSCPFDPSKSSLGHYVHMICRCVVSNYHRRSQRSRHVVTGGLTGLDVHGGVEVLDTTDDRVPDMGADGQLTIDRVVRDFLPTLKNHPKRLLAVPVLLHMLDGQDQTEIARELRVPKRLVVKTAGSLRKRLRAWL